MKKKPMPLFLLTTAVVIAFGLLFTGCGLNQADEGNALLAVDETVDEAIEATLEDREALVDEKLAEVEAREDELAAAREAAQREAAEVAAREAELREELDRAAAEAAAQPVLVTVPRLTALEIDLESELSSETSLAGDLIAARIAQDVIVDGLVAIPAGAEILGTVADVVPSKKFGGQARLLLTFDTLVAPDGSDIAIAAALELAGQGQKKKDAATIGGAAAGGAILGRILNDNDRREGTEVGMVVGGAIGAIVAAKNQADPVLLPAGTPLSVTLDAPVTLELDN